MDGKDFTGEPQIYWEDLWFSLQSFPQKSIDDRVLIWDIVIRTCGICTMHQISDGISSLRNMKTGHRNRVSDLVGMKSPWDYRIGGFISTEWDWDM